MVPFREIDPTAPLASAFVARGLNAVAGIISAGAVAGLTSVLLVLLLGQSRIFFAVSRDGLLPPAFSKIHPRFRTPYIPTTATGIAVGITAALLPVEEIAELTNIGTLFAFVLVCLGVWILRHIDPQQHRPFRTPWVPVVPILGVGFCVFPDGASADGDVDQIFVWLAIGLVIYFTYGRFHSRVNHDAADALKFPELVRKSGESTKNDSCASGSRRPTKGIALLSVAELFLQCLGKRLLSAAALPDTSR